MVLRFHFLPLRGLPGAVALFGITFGWGAFGIWKGFPFGLTTAGVLYLRRFNQQVKIRQ